MSYQNLYKKLLYVSHYRGSKEADHILHNYFKDMVAAEDDEGLIEYELLLDNCDDDIINWVNDRSPTPKKFESVICKIKQYVKSF